MKLTIEAQSINARYFSYGSIYVEIDGVAIQDVIDNLTVKDIFSCANIDELLNEIGVEYLKEYLSNK